MLPKPPGPFIALLLVAAVLLAALQWARHTLAQHLRQRDRMPGSRVSVLPQAAEATSHAPMHAPAKGRCTAAPAC